MQDKEAFRKYLMNDYSGAKTGCPLNAGSTCDVLTHCLRVERALGVDLDEELSSTESLENLRRKIKQERRRFRYTGTRPYFYAIFNLSVRYYYDFLVHSRDQTSRSKKAPRS
jgi:hypothetical protein